MSTCSGYNIFTETESFKQFLINSAESITAFAKIDPAQEELLRFMEIIKDQAIDKVKQLAHSIQEIKS